jgi:hypothetical protein
LGRAKQRNQENPLGVVCPDDYTFYMSKIFAPVPVLIATLLMLTALVGFGGWFAHGGAMFMAAIQTGLSWCL